MSAPTVVAEIGGNHRGELDTALRMIETVASFHLSPPESRIYVKFQKRTPTVGLYPEWATQPHPEPFHAYGDTYLAHRQALEFDRSQHRELKAACEAAGVGYACSVWDGPAARDVMSLEPDYIKVPAARNTDEELIGMLIDSCDTDIHVSVGMATRSEIHMLVELFEVSDAHQRLVLYACTSGYPVAPDDVRLGELEWLRASFGGRIKGFGFSGHHDGIAIDMAAVAGGAEWIERHYTLNRTWPGTDHAASLEPDGFRRLVRDVGVVARARGTKGHTGMLDVEREQRAKLKRDPAAA